MLKLAARTLDVYDDLSEMTVMKKIAAKVANVTLAEPDVIEALDDKSFALILKTASGGIMRRYPIHDADATKLSRAYYEEQKALTLPKEIAETVGAKLAAAEQKFNIRDHKLAQVDELLNAVAYVDAATITLPKTAAWDKEVYGLVVGDTRYFPLHNADLVKAAESRFNATAAGLESHERFIYARNLAAQAEAQGVKLAHTSPVHNYTGDEINKTALKIALDERKRIMQAAGLHTKLIDELADAAGCAPEQGSLEHPEVFAERQRKISSAKTLSADRIIEVLQGIDKVAGLGREQYLRGLADPYAACFKRAEADGSTMADGVDLACVDQTKLKELFSEEFAAEFAADPVGTYSHLPDPHKRMIQELAQAGTTLSGEHAKGDAQGALAPQYSNTTGVAW